MPISTKIIELFIRGNTVFFQGILVITKFIRVDRFFNLLNIIK